MFPYRGKQEQKVELKKAVDGRGRKRMECSRGGHTPRRPGKVYAKNEARDKLLYAGAKDRGRLDFGLSLNVGTDSILVHLSPIMQSPRRIPSTILPYSRSTLTLRYCYRFHEKAEEHSSTRVPSAFVLPRGGQANSEFLTKVLRVSVSFSPDPP